MLIVGKRKFPYTMDRLNKRIGVEKMDTSYAETVRLYHYYKAQGMDYDDISYHISHEQNLSYENVMWRLYTQGCIGIELI